jgi:hypothetical protein
MSYIITSPFPSFNDTDGSPLNNGYVYVGSANLNPVTDPIPVYWDAALTQPAAQPIRTINGYLSRNGSPGRIYTNFITYSFRVTNNKGEQVFSDLNYTDPTSSAGSTYQQVITAIAGQTVFNLSRTYIPGTNNLFVYRNGLRLIAGQDYNETGYSQVTLTAGADNGDEFVFDIGYNYDSAASVDAQDVTYKLPAVDSVFTNVEAKLSEIVSVKDFGAVGDGATDDTDKIQAAINYVAAIPFSGGTVTFSSGGVYRFTNLVFPASTSGNTNGGIILQGNGCTLVKTTASGVGILVQGAAGGSTLRRQNSKITNIKFAVSIAQTSGDYIQILNSDHTVLDSISIESAYRAITVVDSFDTKLSHLYIRNSQNIDVYLYGSTGLSTIETYISNSTFEGVSGNLTKTGLLIESGTSGVYVSNADFTQGSLGVQINHTVQPSAVHRPEWLFFVNTLCDTNALFGWAFSANVAGVYLTQCWASTAGQVGFAINNGTTVFLNGCIAQNNGQHGVSITGNAVEVHVNGGIFACNSTSSGAIYHGINVGTGVSKFSIKNARCGNVSALNLPGQQSVGIYVNAGASDDYQIINNNCMSNVTSALVSLGTGVNKSISGNLGFNPRGYLTPQPAMPASTVAYTNNIGIDADVYVSGGTVSIIETNFKGAGWVTIGTTSGLVRVPANTAIRITYSSAPTWTWFFN